MKTVRSLLFFAAIAFVLYSCDNKKLAAVPANGISATINGASETFNSNDSAGYQKTNLYGAYVSGNNLPDRSSDRMQVALYSATPISAGTYTFSAANLHPAVSPSIVYAVNGGHNTDDFFIVDASGAHPVTINVSVTDSTHIEGTFSGTLISAWDQDTTQRKTIVDGKFSVDIHK